YDFLHGDPLLRLDNRLSILLDGVYRPAEAYLRWLEWFTAIGFGTALGRVITRFLVIPFGGAFLSVEVLVLLLDHVDDLVLPDTVRYGLMLLLSFFLLGLLHVPAFRQRCWDGVVRCGRFLREVFVTWPARLVEATSLREIVASWPFQLVVGYLIKPLAACALL